MNKNCSNIKKHIINYSASAVLSNKHTEENVQISEKSYQDNEQKRIIMTKLDKLPVRYG